MFLKWWHTLPKVQPFTGQNATPEIGERLLFLNGKVIRIKKSREIDGTSTLTNIRKSG